MIAKNMSDQEIIDFLVERYGDFVLYRPPLRVTTTVLWIGPFLLLAIGGTALILAVRRRQKTLPEVVVSEADHQRVEQLLSDGVKQP